MQNEKLKKAAGAEEMYIPAPSIEALPEEPGVSKPQTPPERTYRLRKRHYIVGVRLMYILVAVLLALMMSLGIAFLSRIAVLNDYNKKIEQIGSDIRKQRQIAETLGLQIAEAGKLERIEAEARGRLGMREPTGEEIAVLNKY